MEVIPEQWEGSLTAAHRKFQEVPDGTERNPPNPIYTCAARMKREGKYINRKKNLKSGIERKKERGSGRRKREKKGEREREKKGRKESAGIYGRKTLVRLTLYSKLV